MQTLRTSLQKQRGMSFISLCLLIVVLVFAGYVIAKTVPIVSEYLTLKSALKQAAQNDTVIEVRNAFARAANVGYLDQYANAIKSNDLVISKVNDQVVVTVDYQREVPLFGPASLLYKLHASSQ